MAMGDALVGLERELRAATSLAGEAFDFLLPLPNSPEGDRSRAAPGVSSLRLCALHPHAIRATKPITDTRAKKAQHRAPGANLHVLPLEAQHSSVA